MSKTKPLVLFLVLAWFILCSAPPGQAAQSCAVPDRLPVPFPAKVDWANPKAATDNYILVLSWSPEYCNRHGKSTKSDYQCQHNHFDFVVHGFWPQSDRAKDKFGHPRFCADSGRIEPDTLRKHFCTMPDVNLMQEEWSKHGTCAFATPGAYFGKIEELAHALKIPDVRRITKEKNGNPTAGDFIRAFARENASRGLKEQDVVVWVARGNYLREIVVCYDKNFSYKACTVRGTPYNQRIRVAF